MSPSNGRLSDEQLELKMARLWSRYKATPPHRAKERRHLRRAALRIGAVLHRRRKGITC